MKRFATLTSAVALSFAATGAMAEQHVPADGETAMETEAQTGATANAETNLGTVDATAQTDATSGAWDRAQLIRTRDITGGPVYGVDVDDANWADANYTEVDAEWEQVGEIEDIVLDRSGQMVGVVAEVGGFLDIGDKHVIIPVENVRLVPVDDVEFALVTNHSEDELESMEDIDEGFWD
ncbi:MAG: PRC-barrel domain-containing protein [Celeribacter sp.]